MKSLHYRIRKSLTVDRPAVYKKIISLRVDRLWPGFPADQLTQDHFDEPEPGLGNPPNFSQKFLEHGLMSYRRQANGTGYVPPQ